MTTLDPFDPSQASRIAMLEYHDTEFKLGPTVEMRTEWFLAQMQWLHEMQFQTLTGEQLVQFVQGQARPQQYSCVFRFDLGAAIYQNFHDVILPTLQKYGFHAVCFVLTSMIKDDHSLGCICWQDLLDWEAAGTIEVASHGVNHPDYRQIDMPARLWDARESKKLIEAKLGHPIRFFGFPKDSAPDHPEAFLKPLGYQLAFAGPRMQRSVVFKDPDPYALPCYYPYSDPQAYPAINGMKGLDFGKMMLAAVSAQ